MPVYSSSEIHERRKYIHDTLISRGMKANFVILTDKNLQDMWNLYDEIFFDRQIQKKLQEERSTVEFEVTKGKAGARVAGWCETKRNTPSRKSCHFTLSFPASVYFSLFQNDEKKLKVGGCECNDRLSCLQMIMEHENTHLLMQLYGYEGKINTGKGKNIYSSHGKLFQCMVNSYFGHTDFRHGFNLGDIDKYIPEKDIHIGLLIKYKDILAEVIRMNRNTVGVREIYPSYGRILKMHKAYLQDLSPNEYKIVEKIKKSQKHDYLQPKDISVGTKVKFIIDYPPGATTTFLGEVTKKKIKKVEVREIHPQNNRMWKLDKAILMKP